MCLMEDGDLSMKVPRSDLAKAGNNLSLTKIVKINENNYQILKVNKNDRENFHNVGKTYSLKGLAGKIKMKDLANASIGTTAETFSDIFDYHQEKTTENRKFHAWKDMYGNSTNGDAQ